VHFQDGGGKLDNITLKCEVCTATSTLYNKFCATCGAKLDEETLALKYYFNEGYEYEAILCFLLKYWRNRMSLRTLRERFKSLDDETYWIQLTRMSELDYRKS